MGSREIHWAFELRHRASDIEQLRIAADHYAETTGQMDKAVEVGHSCRCALSHLQLASAQAMMGDQEAARKAYQDFLTLWKDADPDIPIYQQAKAEYAKLR